MLSKDQTQDVGAGALAIQTNGDVNIVKNGLSYAEAKEVALDVFKANFYDLSKAAEQVARARAEQITEDFLEKLQRENPQGFERANDPDFQYALFTVQKEHARGGDSDLGALLVDLLVDRSKQEKRNLLQIVLTECLSTAPKLTEGQLAILAVVFLLRYTTNNRNTSHEELGLYFDRLISPFIALLPEPDSSLMHLEFAGCGSSTLSNASAEEIFSQSYRGLFFDGFDESEFSEVVMSREAKDRFFVRCINDPTKYQVGMLSRQAMDEHLEIHNVTGEAKAKVIELFDRGVMNSAQIKAKCIEIRPYMESLFKAWDTLELSSFTLTSVGIAIGHANIKKYYGEFTNLSIWIK